MTITVFFNSSSSNTQHGESREIDISKNGFEFFDAPISSNMYFTILEIEPNGYDGVDVNERDTFMSPQSALEEVDRLNKESKNCEYEVAVRSFNIYR
jgi:hypothetical protein